MDIEEFTRKFVKGELREICHNTSCSECPFHCVSVKSQYSCKLIQLDEALAERGEEQIWIM